MSHLRPLLAACLPAFVSRMPSSRFGDREQIPRSKRFNRARLFRKPSLVLHRMVKNAERRIAPLGLLLASLLEICGCNPARMCEQLRATRLSAMSLNTLDEQCARCLSEQEVRALRQIRGDLIASDGNAALPGMTVEEILGGLHGPSFNTYGEDGAETDLRIDRRIVVGSGAGAPQETKPIAWPIPESVLFLYASPPGESSPDAMGAPRRIATGFILNVADRRGRSSRYLVTARHVVDPDWAHCGKGNPQSITVRFNRSQGGVGYESISLNPHQARQFITADDVTDLVLIPIDAETVPNLNSYKLVETDFDELPTEDELAELHREQRIVTVGVAAPKLVGLPESPISEPGVIATDVAGGPMEVRCTVESPVRASHMWLIDASVTRGVSGAPVYALLARGPSRLTTPVLIGVQAVVWPDKGQAGVTSVAVLRDLVQRAQTVNEMAMDVRKGAFR